MNRYELGVVIRADLEEDVFRAEMERVKGFIDRFGGTIEKIDDWGRRKLAYPIHKLTEGMYSFITYSSEGGTPKEVESRLRLQENVLRFLTIRRDENEPLVSKPIAEPAEKPVEESVAEEPAVEPAITEEKPVAESEE
ncbi:MAG: 30S ribosomal protein S6 [Defluviitaleaceae bacterium]|nr:30S ribosomal protein S6 [Defluviitaleaceae bacterium]